MRTYVRRPRKPFRSAVDHTDRAMTTEPETRGPSPAALIAIGAAAVAAGALVVFVALGSDHREPAVVWAVFGPLVGWSFIAAGVYAWRIRPRYRTGELMILLGFAWFLFTLDGADNPTAYTLARILGGLWGSVFLHLGLSFPTGRLKERADRVLVLGVGDDLPAGDRRLAAVTAARVLGGRGRGIAGRLLHRRRLRGRGLAVDGRAVVVPEHDDTRDHRSRNDGRGRDDRDDRRLLLVVRRRGTTGRLHRHPYCGAVGCWYGLGCWYPGCC